MSGEHVISAAVLRRIGGEKIHISGLGHGQIFNINSDALKTKHLCKRHNSALGPLDAEAGRLFQAFRDAEASLAAGDPPKKPVYFFSGIDIERWLLKTMIMVFKARLTNVQAPRYLLPGDPAFWLINQMPSPRGLWIQRLDVGGGAHRFTTGHYAEFSILTKGDLAVAIEVTLGGLAFLLLLGEPSAQLPRSYEYRPSYLNFFEDNRVVSVAFVWPNWKGPVLWLSRGKEHASIPTDPVVPVESVT